MVKVKGTHPILHRIREWHVSWRKKEKNQKRKVIQELGQIMAHNREKYKMLFYCDWQKYCCCVGTYFIFEWTYLHWSQSAIQKNLQRFNKWQPREPQQQLGNYSQPSFRDYSLSRPTPGVWPCAKCHEPDHLQLPIHTRGAGGNQPDRNTSCLSGGMYQGDCHCASQKPSVNWPVSVHVLGKLAWLPVPVSLSHLESLPCAQHCGELYKILYGVKMIQEKVQTWRLINTVHTMQSRRHRCLGDVEAAVKKDQREDRPLPAGDSWGHDGKAVLHLRSRCR